MNRKDLIRTVMMISNRKKHFGLQGFHKKLALQGLTTNCYVESVCMVNSLLNLKALNYLI